MKKFNFVYLALAFLGVIAMTSCEHPYADYTPGAKETNQGVYFPSAQNFVVSAEDSSVEILVARLNTAADAEVSVRVADVTANLEGDSLFTVDGTVKFVAEEAEAMLKVTFDGAALVPGVKYSLNIKLDPAEATNYAASEYVFTVTVPEPWVLYGATEEESVGIFFDDLLCYALQDPSALAGTGTYILYEKHAENPNRIRVVNPYGPDTVAGMWGGLPTWMTFTAPNPYYLEFDITDPEDVKIGRNDNFVEFTIDFEDGTTGTFYAYMIGINMNTSNYDLSFTWDPAAKFVLRDGIIKFPTEGIAFSAFQDGKYLGDFAAANQYGYMFKDMPQDMRNESLGKLVKGYATMFIGANAYNALYSSLVGRDVAFDPIGIIGSLLSDLGIGGDDDEEKEPEEVILNFAEDVAQEIPFIGGLLGGGRVPISAALPYDSAVEMFTGTVKDVADEDYGNLTKEWLKPIYYLAMPMGGGQLKKTVEGLSMFSDEHPVAGSYTASGDLRYPVEKTPWNVIQAGMFGQYANKNARYYFDNDIAPLSPKQTQEYIDVDIPIRDYWDYRSGLKGKTTLGEKVAYICTLDLPIAKQNILVNNLTDRKEPIDMTDYNEYSDWGEFDYAKKYPDKYAFLEANGITAAQYEAFDEDTKEAYSWAYQNPEKFLVSKVVAGDVVTYRGYTSGLSDINADKDENGKSVSGSRKEKVISYINTLPIDYGPAIILFKSEYPSDDTYNNDIVAYVESQDLTFEEKVMILTELDFTVLPDGTVQWD